MQHSLLIRDEKKSEFKIFVGISNKNPHFKVCIKEAALSVVPEMRRRCKHRWTIKFLLTHSVEATRCGAAALFIKNIAEKENINGEKILFTSKLKPSH